jgi:TfoX/Sxy family transcriptional regulator of competence genes
MASNQAFVDYVCEQADLAGRITTKRMFGEYEIYVDGKVVAFVCDNQVFVKPTEAGKLILGTVTEAQPYPGAKLYYLINEHLDNRTLVGKLLNTTASVLPSPQPKPVKIDGTKKMASIKTIPKVAIKRSKKPDA